MSNYIQRDEARRKVCHEITLKKLLELGFITDGSEESLEKIILSNGFNTPGIKIEKHKVIKDDYVVDEDEVSFGFRLNGCVYEFYNYADAVAGEIIQLHKAKLLFSNKNKL